MIKGNVKIDRKNLISILQSCLVLILVILVALMMVEIGNLKGTARVINYAGLVRGATQRAVKLEITGTRNDELIAYLDDILSDLTSGDGHYELVKLKDAAYQERLDIQRDYWERLKAEVAAARVRDIDPDTVVYPICATYDAAHREEFFSRKFDYIVDCIDLVSCKLDLIQQARLRGIPILSALGTGNKLDASMFEVADITKTSMCPLARVMRRELSKRGIRHLKVVYSLSLIHI